MSRNCSVCNGSLNALMDCGSQEITNRLLEQPQQPCPSHPFELTQCAECRLIQIAEPAPPSLVMPPTTIEYCEPEGHLDELVDRLIALPGIDSSSRFCGLTYKDASTLQRVRDRGYQHSIVFDAADDLGVNSPTAGVESFQQALTRERASAIREKYGRQDVVIVRHVLEHAHQPKEFLNALKELVTSQGYVVFEAPDFTNALHSHDYASLWEEHVLYFTRDSLASTLAACPWHLVELLDYPNSLENSLVAVVSLNTETPSFASIGDGDTEELAKRFAEGWAEAKTSWRRRLSQLREKSAPIAMLGAGHRAATFINLLELSDLIDFIVDDAPDKVGRYLPGCKIPIKPSSALSDVGVRVCLLTVGVESEPRVAERNESFVKQGGRFASIYSVSDLYLSADETDA